jgi:S1-C subfamily serine protease
MHIWKAGALSGAFVIAAGVGAALAPVAHGQTREREPIVRALQLAVGGAQIGVTVRDPDATNSTGGVAVEDVQDDSPAAKAGIKTGDTIVEFDGERVRSVAQFRRLVQETPDGRTVPTVLMRNGQRVTVSVTPENSHADFPMVFRRNDVPRPAMPRMPIAPRTPAAPAPPTARPYLAPLPDMDMFSMRSREPRLGISTESLTDQLNDYFGVKGGVLVRSVNDDSPAAKAGVKAGDVIVSINGRCVDEPSDITRELRSSSSGDISVDVVRNRKTQTLKVTVESRRRSSIL